MLNPLYMDSGKSARSRPSVWQLGMPRDGALQSTRPVPACPVRHPGTPRISVDLHHVELGFAADKRHSLCLGS